MHLCKLITVLESKKEFEDDVFMVGEGFIENKRSLIKCWPITVSWQIASFQYSSLPELEILV